MVRVRGGGAALMGVCARADDMSVMREEIFGPVLCLAKFKDEAEAISRANATPYGLAAGVFTESLRRAHRVIAQLEAGTCWVNNYNITPVEMPFGGFHMSGMGKENGREALHEYTRVKSVHIEMGEVECGM